MRLAIEKPMSFEVADNFGRLKKRVDAELERSQWSESRVPRVRGIVLCESYEEQEEQEAEEEEKWNGTTNNEKIARDTKLKKVRKRFWIEAIRVVSRLFYNLHLIWTRRQNQIFDCSHFSLGFNTISTG